MMRKDTGKFPRMLGIVYIVFQLLGGIAGALLAWLFQESYLNVNPKDGSVVFQAIVIEVVGTTLVVLFYLSQTEEKTTFSKEKAICCFIIAASYVGARSLGASFNLTLCGVVLNPAIGFGANIVMGTQGLKYIWLYAAVPLGGGIVGLLFHEFVFKKTQEVLSEDSKLHEDDPDSLLD
jgi:glycerol uptake facilitator-like aquaporin